MPANKKKLTIYASIIAIAVLVLLTIFNLNSFLAKPEQETVLGESTGLAEERAFWEDVVSQHPTYKEGWIELAKIVFEMEDKTYALGALKTAKSLDPNSEEISTLINQLGL